MRLPRPHVPLDVRCRVALRQLGEFWPDDVLRANGHRHGALLAGLLTRLAALLACEAADLHLDHDPALGAREKVTRGGGVIVGYKPDANDHEFLIYRTKAAHRIKTNVRGDGAQHPDRVLIKRQRRREKGAHAKPKRCWPSRPFPKGKRRIPSRPFPQRHHRKA